MRRAVFSECEKYRYLLSREWNPGTRQLAFIMLNPSTADEQINDATIARCEERARRNLYGGIIVCNLFAWRSKKPSALRTVADPVGPDNDSTIEMLLNSARGDHQSVICGWGPHGALNDRNRHVAALFAKHGIKPMALKVTSRGHPQHPLYIGYDVQPQPFQIAA